jgi:hypothetical protein
VRVRELRNRLCKGLPWCGGGRVVGHLNRPTLSRGLREGIALQQIGPQARFLCGAGRLPILIATAC